VDSRKTERQIEFSVEKEEAKKGQEKGGGSAGHFFPTIKGGEKGAWTSR